MVVSTHPTPIFPNSTTYAEYCRLRIECGYEAEYAMIREVWDGCGAESQESMLQQFRGPAAIKSRYVATHGEAW